MQPPEHESPVVKVPEAFSGAQIVPEQAHVDVVDGIQAPEAFGDFGEIAEDLDNLALVAGDVALPHGVALEADVPVTLQYCDSQDYTSKSALAAYPSGGVRDIALVSNLDEGQPAPSVTPAAPIAESLDKLREAASADANNESVSKNMPKINQLSDNPSDGGLTCDEGPSFRVWWALLETLVEFAVHAACCAPSFGSLPQSPKQETCRRHPREGVG
ncbi:hypothetical protein HDZ31DRAFT_77553 [Schizophyllum fasciatum]